MRVWIDAYHSSKGTIHAQARFCELVCLVGCFSVPYLIHIPSCSKGGDKGNSSFGFGISIWTGGTGLLGKKCERISQKLSDDTSVTYGSIVNPSHCPGVILFLLCLWLFTNPTSIRYTWSHTGPLTSQSYRWKVIHKESLRAELISSLHCRLNQLISQWWFNF